MTYFKKIAAKTLGFAGKEIIPAVTPDLIPEGFETGNEKQRSSKTILRKSIISKSKPEQLGYLEKSLPKKISNNNIPTSIKEPEGFNKLDENIAEEDDGKGRPSDSKKEYSDIIVNAQQKNEDKVESQENNDKQYLEFQPDLSEGRISDNKDVIPTDQKNTSRKITQLPSNKNNVIHEYEDKPTENLFVTKNVIKDSLSQEYSSKQIKTEKDTYQKLDQEVNNNSNNNNRNKELIQQSAFTLQEFDLKPNQDLLNSFEPETTITINIGRIEIRTSKQEFPNKKQQSKFVPRLSLDEYLKRQKGIQE